MTDPVDTVIDFSEASTELETGASHNAQNKLGFLPLALLEKHKLWCFLSNSNQDVYEGVQSRISGEVAGQVRASRK